MERLYISKRILVLTSAMISGIATAKPETVLQQFGNYLHTAGEQTAHGARYAADRAATAWDALPDNVSVNIPVKKVVTVPAQYVGTGLQCINDTARCAAQGSNALFDERIADQVYGAVPTRAEQIGYRAAQGIDCVRDATGSVVNGACNTFNAVHNATGSAYNRAGEFVGDAAHAARGYANTALDTTTTTAHSLYNRAGELTSGAANATREYAHSALDVAGNAVQKSAAFVQANPGKTAAAIVGTAVALYLAKEGYNYLTAAPKKKSVYLREMAKLFQELGNQDLELFATSSGKTPRKPSAFKSLKVSFWDASVQSLLEISKQRFILTCENVQKGKLNAATYKQLLVATVNTINKKAAELEDAEQAK